MFEVLFSMTPHWKIKLNGFGSIPFCLIGAAVFFVLLNLRVRPAFREYEFYFVLWGLIAWAPFFILRAAFSLHKFWNELQPYGLEIPNDGSITLQTIKLNPHKRLFKKQRTSQAKPRSLAIFLYAEFAEIYNNELKDHTQLSSGKLS
jgi:hypothetical protein